MVKGETYIKEKGGEWIKGKPYKKENKPTRRWLKTQYDLALLAEMNLLSRLRRQLPLRGEL